MERKFGPAIWTNAYTVTFFFQALEGKDIKDLLTNVGSGGAAAPAAVGGAAAGAAAPAEAAAEEKKEEGKDSKLVRLGFANRNTDRWYREGGVRRGHGLRSVRLNVLIRSTFCFLFFLVSLLSPYITRISCTRYNATARRPKREKKKNQTDEDIWWDWALCLHDGFRRDRGTGADDARISGRQVKGELAYPYLPRARSLWPPSVRIIIGSEKKFLPFACC
jgi:large subunit ribosomal protein LP1